MRGAAACVLAAACGAGPAAAQTVNCHAPQTQIEMTACAAQDYQAADAELNRVYGLARDKARAMDAYIAPGEVPAATILRDAQRAWIPFRDQACEAESLIARGGSMQSQLFHACLARLTRQRTADLMYFAEDF